SLSNLLLVTPGLIGVTLGRNPNGAISDMRKAFLPLRKSIPGIAFLVVALGAIWGLRAGDVIDNWTAAIAAVAAPIVALGIAEGIDARKEAEVEAAAVAAAGTEEVPDVVPLEWVGIERPFSDDDVREMNAALGVSEVELYGAARR